MVDATRELGIKTGEDRITSKELEWKKEAENMKRRIFSIVGAIIAFFGLVWFLQGAGVLPGSVMSGSQFWEIAGAATFIIGIAIVAYCMKK